MKNKKFNDEVLFAIEDIVQIDAADILLLKKKAKKNPRKRIRICVHKDTRERIHEMLIVHERSCYVRPHKHIKKSESFHIIEGKADIIIFHDDGAIDQIISMGDAASGLKFYYRLPPNRYHMVLIKTDVLVFHEITNGPFKAEDTNLASWSPNESDNEAVSKFMRMLVKLTKNHI